MSLWRTLKDISGGKIHPPSLFYFLGMSCQQAFKAQHFLLSKIHNYLQEGAAIERKRKHQKVITRAISLKGIELAFSKVKSPIKRVKKLLSVN